MGGQRPKVRVALVDGSQVTMGRGDRAAAVLASRQHGVVSFDQLVAVGITPRAIERRVEAGRLHRVHRRVYAVGHTAESPLAREAAALLACGSGAVLSHRSAGAVWGIVDRPATAVEVTVVGRDCGAKPGIRHRRARHVAAPDIQVRSGLVLTAPARTLLDLGSVVVCARFVARSTRRLSPVSSMRTRSRPCSIVAPAVEGDRG